jgi:hypothetical protein
MDLDANGRFLGFTYTVMTKSNFEKDGEMIMRDEWT